MKKILVIIILGLMLSSNSFAGVTTGYKLGKGPLKVTKNTADIMDEIEDKTSLTSNNSNELDRLKFLNQKPIAGE